MKKSLLILSLLALTATSARAFDTLEAGTADSPNYYLIKANRDNKYVSYSVDNLHNGNVTTNLYRTALPSKYSIWGVTPGDAEGTVVVKNCSAEAYLMQFKAQSGEFTGDLYAIADVTETPVDIYVTNNSNGSVSFRTKADGYHAMDATGGSDLFGNWIANDAGTNYWCTKVDLSNGPDVVLNDMFKPAYIADLEDFKNNVSAASTDLQTRIDAIKAMSDTDPFENVVTAYNEAITAIDNSLPSLMNGNTYCLKNLRREANPNAQYPGCFLAVIGSAFGAGTDITDEKTWFEFESTDDNGVIIYNLAANKYMSWDYKDGETSITTNTLVLAVDSKEEAKPFYPLLNHVDPYYGIAFTFTSSRTGLGLDEDTNAGGLVSWNVASGGGSVFAMIDANPDEIVKEAVAPNITRLEAYIANLPTYEATFNSGIAQLQALKYSSDLSDKISQIVSNTETTVNNELKTAFRGKIYALKNLNRANSEGNGAQSPYVALIPSAGTFANVASDVDPSAWFIFNSNDNDGYTLTNYYNGQYVYCGAADNYTEASSSASESTAVYPVLNYNGHFGGISFPYTADGKGLSMNQNNASDLLSGNTVGAGMDGSIWILSEIEDVDTKVQACLTTICGQFDAFAQNVVPAAEIFTTAKSEAEKVKVGVGAPADVDAVLNGAIAEGTEALNKALVEKNVSVRSLRNGYICAGEDGFSVSAEQSDLANYDFAPAEDGGFTLYSPASGKYIGPAVVVGSEANMTLVAEKADAQVVYPVCYHSGNYCGVAFPISDSTNATTQGFNANGTGLHQYRIGDGGSIFAVKVMGNSTGIEEITAAPAAEGIYDLSGRRLAAPVRGINIINGRKVLVK